MNNQPEARVENPEVNVDQASGFEAHNLYKNAVYAFRLDNENPIKLFSLRNAQAHVFETTGASSLIASARKSVEVTGKTGLEAAEDPSVLGRVLEDTTVQRKALRDLPPLEMDLTTNDINSGSLAHFDPFNAHPIYTEPAAPALVAQDTAPTEASNETVTEGDTHALLERKRYLESEIKKTQEQIEVISAKLAERQERSKSSLEKMGFKVARGLEFLNKAPKSTRLLTGVMFAGAALLTGGVAGGAIMVASRGLSSTFLATGFYEKALAQAEKEAKESGNEVEKGKIALKALGYGLLLSLGTSQVFSIVGQVAGEAAAYVPEKVSHVWGLLKEAYHNTYTVLPVTEDVVTAPVASPSSVQMADTVVDASPLTKGFDPVISSNESLSTVTPEMESSSEEFSEEALHETLPEVPTAESISSVNILSPINFADMSYTIQAGDTYENILGRILPHVPGVEALSDASKAELVKHFREQYGSGFASRFTSFPDMITAMDSAKEGSQIRVDEIRLALGEEIKRRFSNGI